MSELQKRISTSIALLIVLYLCLSFKIILILSLFAITYLLFYETYNVLTKIFKNKKNKLFLLTIISYLYIIFFVILIWYFLINSQNNFYLTILLLICIFSDIGGYIFGKTFKGRKLTKISPKKTYSGMIGSYVFPLSLIIILILYLDLNYNFIFITIFVSTISQIGDLFISYLKRKAKIKDTGSFLPGHGGLLDRLDGILFAIPVGIFLITI